MAWWDPPTWKYEPIWAKQERERQQFQARVASATPYVDSNKTDLDQSAASFALGGSQQERMDLASEVIQRRFRDSLSGAPMGSSPKVEEPPKPRPQGGGGNWLSDLGGAIKDVGEGALNLGGEAISKVGEAFQLPYEYGGKQAAGILTGAAGMERKPVLDEQGQVVGYKREGGTGLLDWLTHDIPESIAHPVRAGQAYEEYLSSLPVVGRIAGQVVANPLSYVGPGLAAKIIPGTGLAANLVRGALNQGGGAAVLSGTYGGYGAQALAERYGLPEELQPYAALAGGFAGGMVGGSIAASLRQRPVVTRLAYDEGASNALMHQLEFEAGLRQEPLAPIETKALGRLQGGYQPSFAEAIPPKGPVTGVPIRPMEGGAIPGLGESTGYAEYVGNHFVGTGQVATPTIYINDELLARAPGPATEVAIRLRMLPHEEAHGIFDNLSDGQKNMVANAVNTSRIGMSDEAPWLAMTKDLNRRWGYAITPTQRASEAFSEAWASRIAGQDTPYSQVLGSVVDDILNRVLTPEQRLRARAEARRIQDWTARAPAIDAGLEANQAHFATEPILGSQNAFDVKLADGSLGGIIHRTGGQWRLQLYDGTPAQTFRSFSEAERAAGAATRDLMPFKTGAPEGAPQGPEYEGRRVIPDSRRDNSEQGLRPLAKERLWFHSTRDMSYDLPDPDMAVGTQTGITQGPGVYLAADPAKSVGYGNRTFATEFDGNVLDLTARGAPETPLYEGGPTWRDVAERIDKRFVDAGLADPGNLLAPAGLNQSPFTKAEMSKGGTNYRWRDTIGANLAEYLRRWPQLNPEANARDGLTAFADMAGRFKSDRWNADNALMGIVNDALAESGVDALFHHSPRADGDVLIVLNGEKARVLGDFRNAPDVVRGGQTWSEIRGAAGEGGTRKVDFEYIKEGDRQIRAWVNGEEVAATIEKSDGGWRVIDNTSVDRDVLFPSEAEALKYVRQKYETADARFFQAPDDKPTFLGMQPHEIAEMLGLDTKMVRTLADLDMRYGGGQLTKAEEATRLALSRRLRQEYADRTGGQTPVWVLPPGSRDAAELTRRQRVQKLEAAGYSADEITAMLPKAYQNVSGQLSDYVGHPDYTRAIALKRTALDPTVPAEVRQRADAEVARMFGVQPSTPESIAPAEAQIGDLQARQPQAPGETIDLSGVASPAKWADLPAVSDMESIIAASKEASARGETLAIRWSRGPWLDISLKGTKDTRMGRILAGLSSTHAGESISDVRNAITSYGQSGVAADGARPWLIVGKIAEAGPDGEPVLTGWRAVGRISDALLKTAQGEAKALRAVGAEYARAHWNSLSYYERGALEDGVEDVVRKYVPDDPRLPGSERLLQAPGEEQPSEGVPFTLKGIEPPPSVLDTTVGPPAPPAPSQGLTGGNSGLTELPATGTQPALPTLEPPKPRTSLSEHLLDLFNLPRVLMTSWDLSGMMRQGWIVGSQYPKQFAHSIGAMMKALGSEEGAATLRRSRWADPDWKVLVDNGMYEGTYGADAKLGSREEAFMSKYASRIPGVRASERAYVEGLNELRYEVGKIQLRKLRVEYGDNVPPEAIRNSTSVLNAATGRGDLKGLTDAGPAINALMFSPRFLASRVQLAMQAIRGGDAQSRALARRTFGVWLASGVTSLAVLKAASEAGIVPGLEVGVDPNSADWGKIKLGNTRYDLWAGYAPLARYAFKAGKELGTGQADQVLPTLGKFARGKLAPVPASVVNLLQGENAVGEEYSPTAANLSEQMVRQVTPILFQDMWDAFREEGLAGVAKTAVPSALGVGVQTYASNSEQLDKAASTLTGGKVTSYFDLSPLQRDQVKKAHPDVWKEYVASASPATQRAESLRGEILTRQQSADDQLLSGQMNREDWIKAYEANRDELKFRLMEVYQGREQQPPKTPLDFYAKTIRENTAQTGQTNWTAVNQWLDAQPATDQLYIEQNTGLGNTPTATAYRQFRKAYFDLPKYRGFSADEGFAIDQLYDAIRTQAKSGKDADMLAALPRVASGYPPNVVSGVRRKIVGLLSPDMARQRFLATAPGKVFFGKGPLSMAEQLRLGQDLPMLSAPSLAAAS